jgi:hypothetical protein
MKKINTAKEFDVTMVWYLNDEKAAVVADVTKEWDGWQVKFRGQRMSGYSKKADAVAKAKAWLKASM